MDGMIAMALAGCFTAFSVLALLHKLGLRRVLGYDLVVDVVLTVGTLWMFNGTYSGMVVAAFADVVIVVALYVMKGMYGFERYYPKQGWKRFPPTWAFFAQGWTDDRDAHRDEASARAR